MTRYFRWEVNALVAGLACAAIVALVLQSITVVHAAKANERRACRWAVDAEQRARPVLKRLVASPDPCVTLARIRGEGW